MCMCDRQSIQMKTILFLVLYCNDHLIERSSRATAIRLPSALNLELKIFFINLKLATIEKALVSQIFRLPSKSDAANNPESWGYQLTDEIAIETAGPALDTAALAMTLLEAIEMCLRDLLSGFF